jgi:sucrose phosphorylase
MSDHPTSKKQVLPGRVMLNAYPDSMGEKLSDTVALLKRPEFESAFSLFYILPTFFNSDLDRGFSVVDYDINEELVSRQDLDELSRLGIQFKLDLVLNHLSVRSPQFQDLLQKGTESRYRDFFVDWNEFWGGEGAPSVNGKVTPPEEHLKVLFMRKPELPVLTVTFPDGTHGHYWNTFYQKVEFDEISAQDFVDIDGIAPEHATAIARRVNDAIEAKQDLEAINLGELAAHKEDVLAAIFHKRSYLGQMDLNARSETVWEFYDETLRKLRDYGARIVRLDAFAYLHKKPGQPNFFNRPGTWDYLHRLRGIAQKYDLVIFPEIHAEYGAGIHEEIASEGFPIYDFFFPGLIIDTLERGTNETLLRWIGEITARNIETINMLGSHDGIPVLDLRGKKVNGCTNPGLLTDAQIGSIIETIVDRGGRIKNLFGHNGNKIAYYQVNATFFSALGEDERKLRLARAIQMFMPGIPQVWYLDLFAGTNDYEAADAGGTAGHKEINRTNLTMAEIESRLDLPIVTDQLELIRLRNLSPAFDGEMKVLDCPENRLHIAWEHPEAKLRLEADLENHGFTIYQDDGTGDRVVMSFE